MTTSDGTESGTPDEPIEIGDSSDVAAPRGDGIDVGGKAVAWGQRRPRSRVRQARRAAQHRADEVGREIPELAHHAQRLAAQ